MIPIEPTGETLKPFEFRINDSPTFKHWDILITKPDGSLAAGKEKGKDWVIEDAEYALRSIYELFQKQPDPHDLVRITIDEYEKRYSSLASLTDELQKAKETIKQLQEDLKNKL